jgi:dipeptidase
MEIIGKGKDALGAVWVARKIPDGYVSGHANQARITTFPQDAPDECVFASDVVTFAQEKGYYPADAAAADFSFSDVYDPVTFEGARFCEARVWSFFGNVTSQAWAAQYEDYASGYNLTNRMPLWVSPAAKLSVGDVQRHMRNHFEGTSLTMAEDVGAEGYGSPYRSHPLTWSAASEEYAGKVYLNERPIGTQQTGWNFVAQCRGWMPRQFSGLLWFGVDDAATTVRFPVYGCATTTPAGWGGQGPQDGVVPPVMTFSMDKAFHVFNLVANWAYPRWQSVYPVLLEKAHELDAGFLGTVAATDATLQTMADAGEVDKAVAVATAATSEMGVSLLAAWRSFFGELFVRFRDGYDISVQEDDPECGCSVGNDVYRGTWYDRIVDETGDHLLDPDASEAGKLKKQQQNAKPKPRTKSKLLLKALL